MVRSRENRDDLEEAMAALADLEGICKVLLLRVEQIERRAPSLDGLVSPMPDELVYIMRGIRKAQQAHSSLWTQWFMVEA